ncbi:MAG: ABC transporter substrate-binding protein, partial [Bacteroidota bacterium]|nr:ABC transporter substrate-binding protein [Bacteroidota bacterium]
ILVFVSLRKVYFFVLLLIISISCNNSEFKNANKDKTVFRYNESKGIASLDPAFAKTQTLIWPTHQLFNSLVQMDSDLTLLPSIAKEWEILNKGKQYVFYLRDDIYFHDNKAFKNGIGRKLIAEDVVYSLKRIYNPETASPGAWIFNVIDKAKGIQAIGDSIVQINLKHSFPAFLGLLSMQYCSVIPKEAVDFYGDDFRANPVGTGPFKFKYWKEGEKLIFVKNKNYFEKDTNNVSLPYLDAVAISFITDKQTEFLEFVKGNLDFISGVNYANKDELLTRSGKLKSDYSNRINMITQPYLNTEYLGFLVDKDKCNSNNSVCNRNVRLAINYGFDRKKMIKYLRNNIGSPAINGFIPQGMPSFDSDYVGYTYNPEKAEQLLADAGYPKGKGLETIKLTTTSDYLDLCEYIQRKLSQLGINLEIDVSTGATFRDMVANSKLEFFRGSWIADYPDAENYLSLFYSKNFSPEGPNYTHFENEDYDRMYELAMNTVNDSARYRLYRKMDEFIIDNAVVVPLYYDQVVRFYQKNVLNLGSNAMNLLSLKRVKKIK